MTSRTLKGRNPVQLLVSQAIPHALIGGVAVGIRSGVPRATLDVYPGRRRRKRLRDEADIALLRGDVAMPTKAGERRLTIRCLPT